MCRIHVALQEFQATALILCGMAFQLFGKVVVLQLDNNTIKAYLCKQVGTVLYSLSIHACCILNLANNHGITLIPAYHPTHLNEEVDYLSLGNLGF